MKWIALLALVFTSCSGGGGGGTSPAPYVPAVQPAKVYCYDSVTVLQGKPWASGAAARARVPNLLPCGVGARIYAIHILRFVESGVFVQVAAQDAATATSFLAEITK